MKSSSIHSLSADTKYTRYIKPLGYLWFLLNWLNNSIWPCRHADYLQVRDFKPEISDEIWRRTDPQSSPSRKLSNLFWMQLPWREIEEELGQIHVLDVGCGSGRYGPMLDSFSGNRLTSYTGIDLNPKENWKRLLNQYPDFNFHRLDSTDILSHIPQETNFIMSQSAIEHFRQDLTFFRQIAQFIDSSSKNVIQVHVFPSKVCLKLYRLHGVRQYTPRTVSSIAHIFETNSYSVLFNLGGSECNRLHWEAITKPRYFDHTNDLINSDIDKYDRRLRTAITSDNRTACQDPSFYALIIHSNWDAEVVK